MKKEMIPLYAILSFVILVMFISSSPLLAPGNSPGASGPQDSKPAKCEQVSTPPKDYGSVKFPGWGEQQSSGTTRRAHVITILGFGSSAEIVSLADPAITLPDEPTCPSHCDTVPPVTDKWTYSQLFDLHRMDPKNNPITQPSEDLISKVCESWGPARRKELLATTTGGADTAQNYVNECKTGFKESGQVNAYNLKVTRTVKCIDKKPAPAPTTPPKGSN
ncbi:MAG: hypothetical protein ACP5NS_01420 [Candidatus Pacearchaeota archaeon]